MRVALGLIVGFAAATAMTLVAFGANLPNLGQQDRLVIPYGIPNLTGLALGFGGDTAPMRNVADGAARGGDRGLLRSGRGGRGAG